MSLTDIEYVLSEAQTAEANAFIQRIIALPPGPGVSLDDALQPSLDDEAELRRLFATDKTNARLANPYVGLLDLFDAPVDLRTTRARVPKDAVDLIAKHVMPLLGNRRRAEGAPATVCNLADFKRNWSVFTENSLSQLTDWSNVVAAGGSVLACLAPLPEYATASKRSIRKYYHSAAYPTSDVDLFLWGMPPEQAEVKINAIYEAVRDSVPWDVTCVRTKHTVSIHSQYPYRSVQIVLRLYSSPAEILAGFDIDAPCCAYDGNRVWMNPRAIVANMRQCNTVDMTRRSPSYEIRLAKYAARNFEVYVPTLKRLDVDPTIYERSIARIEGLARLLVLEKLADADARTNFISARRILRGRPAPPYNYQRRRNRRKFKGDLKAEAAFGGLEMNDYDVASLHIPYGEGWDARRIEKLVYQTDLGMNSTFNPKNKGRRLHRHPAFFGTMEECLEDCCEHCPDPQDKEERKLQEEEDANYIRGRIAFIEENPGRQSISGSFNPIDVGEWSGQVYVGPTEKFFQAIVSRDRALVAEILRKATDFAEGEVEAGGKVDRRDHIGRTPLHVAILAGAEDIACDLIDAGARISPRLVDGRTALHLAAQMDMVEVVRKLLEKSAINAEAAKKAEEDKAKKEKTVQTRGGAGEEEEEGDEESDCERPSSEDDWSSEEEEKPRPPKKLVVEAALPAPSDNIPEDDAEAPDVLDINAPDWDHAFTPLLYCILYGSVTLLDELLNAGADVKLLTKASNSNSPPLHPLTTTLLRPDEEVAAKIAARLIQAGASSSTADENMMTILHRAVLMDKTTLVAAFFRHDPNATAAINFPTITWGNITPPINTAIASGNYAMLAVLLAHGAKLVTSQEDVERAVNTSSDRPRYYFGNSIEDTMNKVTSPVEIAIACRNDVVSLILEAGANPNVGIKLGLQYSYNKDCFLSLFDWVRFAVQGLSAKLSCSPPKIERGAGNEDEKAQSSEAAPPASFRWKDYHADMLRRLTAINKAKIQATAKKPQKEAPSAEVQKIQDQKMLDFLLECEKLLLAYGAKTWDEIYPTNKASTSAGHQLAHLGATDTSKETSPTCSYYLLSESYYRPPFVGSTARLYDQLFDACLTGDTDEVQQLCLPSDKHEPKSQATFVSVEVGHPTNQDKKTGYTPLFAALSKGHWETARLVLAIATAQYRPEDDQKGFSTKDVILDEDSDNESDDSCDSEDTIDQKKVVNFIDIAALPAQVHTKIPPKRLLEASSEWLTKDGSNGSGSVIIRAICDGDLEAFIQIADLYQAISLPLGPDGSILNEIMKRDRPEMLDEYIRHTGDGVDITVTHIEPMGNQVVATKSKTYLGLNVRGKKRKDLAKDPKAITPETSSIPLLWQAAKAGATGIISYLAGDRPLAAYRFYSFSNIDERADFLRHCQNLETILPTWLGWVISSLNESPLTGAVAGNSLDSIEMLVSKNPRLMASALHDKIKFLGYNLFMLAVDRGVKPDLCDHLLSKGVSPTEVDLPRRWNIFHIASSRGHNDLLEHLLSKLPSETIDVLLQQQSKGDLDTPFHIAAKAGKLRTVKILMPKSKLHIRDVNGYTPLHLVVQAGFAELTRLLLDAGGLDALHMENGVGQTPLEIATQQELLWRMTLLNGSSTTALVLQYNSVTAVTAQADAERNSRVSKLKTVVDELIADGRLQTSTRPCTELLAFVERMEAKAAPFSEAKEKQDEEEENKDPRDQVNRALTLQLVQEAIARHASPRSLLRLLDVQQSVQSSLNKFKRHAPLGSTQGSKGLDLEPGRSSDVVERKKGLVFSLEGLNYVYMESDSDEFEPGSPPQEV